MSNPPYLAAARVRYSVIRRRALAAQLKAEAEAERSRRPKLAEPSRRPKPAEQEQVSTSTTTQEG